MQASAAVRNLSTRLGLGASPVAAAVPPIFPLPRYFAASSWKTSAAIMLADTVALSAVYWLAVLSRYLVSHGYLLSDYIRLFPTAGLFLIAFYIKGLYPGLLLHPAEEMRRVVCCIASVFVVIGAATFFWRNAEAYSRSVFLITWAAGAPIVLLARHFVRKIFASKAWWGVPAVVLGSGIAARRVLRSLQDGTLGVKVSGVFSEEQIFSWPYDLPPRAGPSGVGASSGGLAPCPLCDRRYAR
jgi:hypothetical protein